MTWNRVYNASSWVNACGALPVFTGLAKLACSQLNWARTHLFKYQLTPEVVSKAAGLERSGGSRRFVGEPSRERLLAHFQPVGAEEQFPRPRAGHRRGRVEGTQRFDLLAVLVPLFARQKIGCQDVIAVGFDVHHGFRGR